MFLPGPTRDAPLSFTSVVSQWSFDLRFEELAFAKTPADAKLGCNIVTDAFSDGDSLKYLNYTAGDRNHPWVHGRGSMRQPLHEHSVHVDAGRNYLVPGSPGRYRICNNLFSHRVLCRQPCWNLPFKPDFKSR